MRVPWKADGAHPKQVDGTSGTVSPSAGRSLIRIRA